MRLIFKKGKQRELIEKYKKKHESKNWNEIATILSVNPNALKEWRFETVSLPSKVYFQIDKTKDYEPWIIDRKEDAWGQSVGGKRSPGRRIAIKIPKRSPQLAEFFGIIMGDGNVYANKKHGVYQIRIACHPTQEREYALYVSDLFRMLFELKTTLTKRGRGLYVCADSRYLTDFLFENLPGLKGRFSFPPWIWNDQECLRSFVRGLIDTDGSVYRLSNKNPETIRIGFKNADRSLSYSYRKALIKLSFHPSKLTYRNIFLTRKEDVRSYLKEIGFHNGKHRERLQRIAPSSSGQISTQGT